VKDEVLIKNREKAQVVSGIVSIIGNAILFAAKIFIGMLTGSTATILSVELLVKNF